MQTTHYGYVRVSTKEQCEDRQILALNAYGIFDKNIYIDKISGKDFNRPNYLRLLKKLRQGDVLIIKSIDRLGRNYEEILSQWRHLTKKLKVNIVVIDMPLLDTRNQGKDLTGLFISDLVLQILSYVAQTERENIKQRQKEGIDAARKRGVKFGRPRKKIPHNFHQVKAQWLKREISTRQAARALNIAPDTFARWVKEL